MKKIQFVEMDGNTPLKEEMKIGLLKNSIRLAIAGYLYDGGEVDIIPIILREVANDYKKAIKGIIKK